MTDATVTSPGHEKGHTYATEAGGKRKAPSVTTITGMLEKPGMPWGAAGETAKFAIHHQDEWINLDEDAAYERLRKHHRGVWDAKAAKGTLVHDMATQWIAGQAVECPEECGPYMDALERFILDHDPQWIETERCVIYTDAETPSHRLAYGGRFDFIATLADGRRVLGDWKTGRRYPVEVAMQLAAYRYADAMGIYDEAHRLIDTQPMPTVDACVVVYLHDSGSYEMLELPANRDTHGYFLRLRCVYNWRKEMQAWERAHPEVTMPLAAELATAGAA